MDEIGHRYPESLRSAILELLRSGVGRVALSRAIGVPVPTLFKWTMVAEDDFRKVAVAEKSEMGSGGLTVVLLNGVRIECPSVGVLSQVLEYFK